MAYTNKRPGGKKRPPSARTDRSYAARAEARRVKTEAQERSFTITQPAELLPFLLEHLPSMGRNSVKSVLSHGQVRVDGVPVTRHNHELKPGQTVVVGKERAKPKLSLTGLRILHEDEDVIVVRKESGLLSMSSSRDEENTVYRQLMGHIRLNDPNGRLFALQLLEKDASGVMLLAKTEAAQTALHEQWSEGAAKQVYTVLVEGKIKKAEDKIESWLHETKTLKMYASRKPGDGLHAVLRYKLVRAASQVSLLDVTLETNRKNQLRAQFEDIGHPVVGDKKYGSTLRVLGRLGLHVRELTFVHPTSGKKMTFETEVPKNFLAPFKEND
ncbi:RluA family pseudouridine synthase [Saccharibacillus sp. CPCC 101409]|uniref:RluA family pseudouridine synthase n=1 Tax=Saccharibacillus sp. CPCC 101409 TaxID=3058041 RepID=UPI0026730FD0|nr:RluA family pseudouridine synthase [Saccharibacillus sp. CPCC 101409]MDO3408726.1 RluA family pseudouridine synthase [Saccharibacillus sp. CPCC 101409]